MKRNSIIAALLLMLLAASAAMAQGVTNIGSKWSAGDIVFYKVSDGTTLMTIATTGVTIPTFATTTVTATTANATTLQIGGTAVSSTAAELNQYCVNGSFVDAGTAGSVFVVVPHAGTIASISVVNNVASTTTKTVFTGAIAGTPITHPACEIAATATAGTKTTVVPTAANTVAAGDVIEIASDGGTDATMPVTVTLTITR